MSWIESALQGFMMRLAQWPVPVLIALCLFAWLPGLLALPALDRDESRFAQASKQMIETGDYIDIRFSTVPRYNKPVGVYWMQAASARVFGRPPYNQIWTYRLPSLLGALLAVLLTFWCGRAVATREAAMIGAALLGLTVLLSSEAEIATTDALLLATIVAAQGVFLRAYLFHHGLLATKPCLLLALTGWAAIGVGILLKGPVIVAVVGLTAIAVSLWDRDWTWLRGVRAGPGILVMLAVVLPWTIAIALASHGAFYQRALGHDFAAKIMAGQESHGAPPGYYLALSILTFWPATLFALPAIGSAVRARTEPVIRYLFAWIVPNWLAFEIVPTKLPHYILPVYPALALLVGLWIIQRDDAEKPRRQRILQLVATVLFLPIAPAAIAAAILAPLWFGVGISPVSVIGAALVLTLAVAAVLLQSADRLKGAVACALAAALLLYPLLSAGVAPQIDRLWMSRTLAARVAADRALGDPPAILAGYLEPSLVFLLGTDTRLESATAAGTVAARQGGLALIGDKERNRFLDALHRAGGTAKVIDQVAGFDYSRGQQIHITFYRVRSAVGTSARAK